MEDDHRDEIDRRFADSALNAPINDLGANCPSVESVLGAYEQSFGSTVYMDTRYFAEPTTMLKEPSLKGGNLMKDTPYPIFLPVVVQTMLDVYAFFSGAERLKRLGADVSHGSSDPGNDQHRHWGLVPASGRSCRDSGCPQRVAWDEHHADREVFSRFKATHPPVYATWHRYGGQTLLFYRADKDHPEDGETVIDGLECKVWYAGSLGIRLRYLYLLADALEPSADSSPSAP